MFVKVIFGSSTGQTEATAKTIADAFGARAVNIADASADDFDADLVLLGSSTWGCGDLQDDWDSQMELLEKIDFTGKKVAVFGFGDQACFADTFCNALGILAKKAISQGATLVGQTSADGYDYGDSESVQNGTFVGLALDNNNQPELTDERVARWIESLKNV